MYKYDAHVSDWNLCRFRRGKNNNDNNNSCNNIKLGQENNVLHYRTLATKLTKQTRTVGGGYGSVYFANSVPPCDATFAWKIFTCLSRVVVTTSACTCSVRFEEEGEEGWKKSDHKSYGCTYDDDDDGNDDVGRQMIFSSGRDWKNQIEIRYEQDGQRTRVYVMYVVRFFSPIIICIFFFDFCCEKINSSYIPLY